MIAPPIDWLLDRTVVGGYTALGYRLRGLDGAQADPEGRLDGKRVLVTGANSGIGAAAAAAFAAAGAEVHMVVRNPERGREALERIGERTGSDRLHLHRCDLADLDQVRRLGAELRDSLTGLDVLVHNAGALFQERGYSPQGHEMTWAVHVLGPFLLTHELAPLLAHGSRGRVIFVTSGGMYTARLRLDDPQLDHRDFDGPGFYAHAKRAQVVLTSELDRRLGPDVTVHVMHPGWAETPGVSESLPRFHSLMGPLLRSPEAGADTIVWLAASPEAELAPGRLWMDRRPRPEHRVPWTRERPGEGAELYRLCAQLTDVDVPPTSQPDEQTERGPAGVARAFPSP
jgi:dehydrogenase/reductase SDR family protein 12